MNLLEFTDGTVTQRVTLHGSQDARFTDLAFSSRTQTLSFRIGGKPEAFKMHEITQEVGRKLIEARNWSNLRHGLKIQSTKTLDWLAKHGIKA